MKDEIFEEKKRSAKWALYYIDKIGEKLAYKLQTLTNPYDEFRVLVQDQKHNYDSDGIKLTIKTLNRMGFNMALKKYRIRDNGNYAYIFKLSKIKK